MAKQREGGKVVDMYRGSSSLGCGTVQVRRVWFILSRLASMRARPGTIAHVLGSAVSTAPGDAVCSSHSQQWGSEPQVTFCGCAVAVPAAAAERQSWILPRWKTPGLTDLEAERKHGSECSMAEGEPKRWPPAKSAH